MFVMYPSLYEYLNKYFNNFDVYCLDKEEFFKFIKKCVLDFRVTRRKIPYISHFKKQNKLFKTLQQKYPIYKSYDIHFMCDLINFIGETNKNKFIPGSLA